MGDWRDFNDAPEQGAQTVDADGVRRDLVDRLESALAYLFPNGTTRNGTFQVGDLMGSKGDSLSVALSGDKRGLWTDFATGEGGDVIDLWAGAHGLSAKADFPRVIEGVAEWLGTAPPSHAPSRKARKSPPMDDLGPPTATWFYRAADGRLIAVVYRYDPPGGKTFRPWDATRQKWGDPTPWPLYNQPGMVHADTVVLVEGEKCVDALIQAGICATTAMHGAGALSRTDKTDWSPLKGKSVVVWPDRDAVGWRYAEAIAKAAAEAGARSVAILVPPEDRPEKWDAADAVAEGFDCAGFIRDGERKSVKTAPPAWEDFREWSAGRFTGPAPVQEFLVEGVFPLGVVAILAAMGDTGKGMFTLDLALKVARKGHRSRLANPDTAFGGIVAAAGAVVILSAEDDAGEIHRRLERIDRYGWRKQCADRLWVVPLPNAGGPFPIVRMGATGLQVTAEFIALKDQLKAIPELRLVVFDPLSSFIHADVSKDPAAGTYATGLLASLATETGATVLVAHHMRKPQNSKPVTTPEAAREAVRGTSAIVDGVRVAYALWPPEVEFQKQALQQLERPWTRNAVFQGAVVKANGPADRRVRTYVRGDTGLLEDRTDQLQRAGSADWDLRDALVAAVARAAREGHPFTHTGASGLHGQRERLPAAFHEMGRNRIEALAQNLLNDRPPRIVKVKASGSHTNKWLDVPDGPFALGEGEFEHGAAPISDGGGD